MLVKSALKVFRRNTKVVSNAKGSYCVECRGAKKLRYLYYGFTRDTDRKTEICCTLMPCNLCRYSSHWATYITILEQLRKSFATTLCDISCMRHVE